MTLTIAGAALALLTGYLLLEDWWWQRQHRQRQAAIALPVVRGKCLCCPGTPMVEDIFTHSRLVHRSRVVAPEDSVRWSA